MMTKARVETDENYDNDYNHDNDGNDNYEYHNDLTRAQVDSDTGDDDENYDEDDIVKPVYKSLS